MGETIEGRNCLWAKRLLFFPIKQAIIANMAPERGSAIAKSNFPMYTVKALDGQHFLVAGGGGQAKTGVSNAIVINTFKKYCEIHDSNNICQHIFTYSLSGYPMGSSPAFSHDNL